MGAGYDGGGKPWGRGTMVVMYKGGEVQWGAVQSDQDTIWAQWVRIQSGQATFGGYCTMGVSYNGDAVLAERGRFGTV